MKRCPNNHDNPDNAQFCRICGYRFAPVTPLDRIKNLFNGITDHLVNYVSSWKTKTAVSTPKTFTPDAFPNISLSPCSVVDVKFDVGKGIISCIVITILGFIVFGEAVEDLIYRINIYDPTIRQAMNYGRIGVSYIFFIIAFVKFISFLYRYCKWITFRINADYIESRAFVKNYYRIAKNCKLGLFDKESNTVVLHTSYNNITSLDSYNLLVEEDGKLGLYSLNTKSMIIPAKYDRISGFVNSIATCQKGSSVYHYDVNGNKLK